MCERAKTFSSWYVCRSLECRFRKLLRIERTRTHLLLSWSSSCARLCHLAPTPPATGRSNWPLIPPSPHNSPPPPVLTPAPAATPPVLHAAPLRAILFLTALHSSLPDLKTEVKLVDSFWFTTTSDFLSCLSDCHKSGHVD